VFLKRCKGEARQQFKFAGGNIWLNHTGKKGQMYCVPFVQGARLETRRCFGFKGMLGDSTNRFHALAGGHAPASGGH
jgi:hypothetical protein